MPTIATNDGPYSGLPNNLVRAANGIDYAYRDTGPGARAASSRVAAAARAAAAAVGSWSIRADCPLPS
jgi:hypothetical protein